MQSSSTADTTTTTTTTAIDVNPQQQNQQQQQQYQQQQQQWMQQQYQQQQQWMMMQYPAAAMTMQQQHMFMYQQHYMQYQQQQQQYQQQQLQQQQSGNEQQQEESQQRGSNEEGKTIWIGDLQHWMDETYLHSCFAHSGEVSLVKVIRNKYTGQSEGYGFIEFGSHSAAEKVLHNYNGTPMPNAPGQSFRMNWATINSGERRLEGGSDYSIFVGDLAPDVTDDVLQETFASRYPSVKGAKVVTDLNTGRSKGYGFVRFGDESEKSSAMMEMNGVYCLSRPMRIGVATPKKAAASGYSSQGENASNGRMPSGSQNQTDSNSSNTTIFVGGLDSDVTDEDLRQVFSQHGEITSVKIPNGKGCGFVQFANRNNAEAAMDQLNGTIIGNQTVRLSWGRNPGHKQHWRTDSSKHWNGGGYEANGYDNGYSNGMQQRHEYAEPALHGAS